MGSAGRVGGDVGHLVRGHEDRGLDDRADRGRGRTAGDRCGCACRRCARGRVRVTAQCPNVALIRVAGVRRQRAAFLITWGQAGVDSGVAGVLMAVMPLATLAMARVALGEEPFGAAAVAGFSLGFAGVVVLMGPGAVAGLGGSGEFRLLSHRCGIRSDLPVADQLLHSDRGRGDRRRRALRACRMEAVRGARPGVGRRRSESAAGGAGVSVRCGRATRARRRRRSSRGSRRSACRPGSGSGTAAHP